MAQSASSRSLFARICQHQDSNASPSNVRDVIHVADVFLYPEGTVRCPECGAAVRADAAFCPNCGAPIAASNSMPQASATEPAPQVTVPAPPPAPAAAPVERGQNRAPAIALAVVAVVALAVAFVVFVLPSLGGGDVPGGGDAVVTGAGQTVPFLLHIDGFDEDSTSIPLRVRRVADGQEQIAYVGIGTGFNLEEGEYEVSVAASPISSSGVLYEVPDTVYSVTVAEDGVVIEPSREMTFTPKDPAMVSQEELEAAHSYAQQDPRDDGRADRLASLAEQRRSEAAEDASSQREAIALEFVQLYYTNAQIEDEAYPDGTHDVSAIRTWHDDCLAYIAPGSDLYRNFNVTDYQEAQDLYAQGDIAWGFIEAWSVCRDAEIVSVAGDTVTVHVTFDAGNGAYMEGAAPIATNMTVTFDENNMIVGLATDGYA